MAIDMGNAWDTANLVNPGNKISPGNSWGGMAGRMALGGTPTIGDLKRPLGLIKSAVMGGIFGQNSMQPNAYKIDETQSNRDYDLGQGARGMQAGLGYRLTEAMNGGGPTVAGVQAQQGVAQAMQNAGTQAASARGMSRALAQRTAAYGGMQAQQQANRDAALMRAQEQLAARGQYAGVADSMRQGDAASRQQDIGIEQGNQQAWGQQEALRSGISEGNASRAQKGTGAIMSSVGGAVKGLFSDIRAKEEIRPVTFAERLSQDLQSREDPREQSKWAPMVASMQAGQGAQQAGTMRLNSASDELQAPQESGGLPGMDGGKPGIGGAIGGGLESFGNGLMSDARSKERIQQLENELANRPSRNIDPENPYHDYTVSHPVAARMAGEIAGKSAKELAPVKAYEFSYKPPVAARMAGEMASRVNPALAPAVAKMTYQDAREPRVGVMAQDLEKSKVGREVVGDTPVGKMLDLNRSVGLSLAGVADLNERIRKLEGQKKAAR